MSDDVMDRLSRALHTALHGECPAYPGGGKACNTMVCDCLSPYAEQTPEELVAALAERLRAAVVAGRLRVDEAQRQFGYDSLEFAEARAVWLEVVAALGERVGTEQVQRWLHEAAYAFTRVQESPA